MDLQTTIDEFAIDRVIHPSDGHDDLARRFFRRRTEKLLPCIFDSKLMELASQVPLVGLYRSEE